jgi:hypothetical protein
MDSFKYFFSDFFLPFVLLVAAVSLAVWSIVGPLIYMESKGRAEFIRRQTGEVIPWYVVAGMSDSHIDQYCKFKP